jgi:transposase InsO family protein
MDFITGLPTSSRGNDSIWVIVDSLSKVAHFLSVKTTYQSSKLAELYIVRIVSLYGVTKNIVSDRGTQFTSRFWKKVQEGLGTRLDFSTAYHPQTDGQTERVNQILEDMLRACVLEYGSKSISTRWANPGRNPDQTLARRRKFLAWVRPIFHSRTHAEFSGRPFPLEFG